MGVDGLVQAGCLELLTADVGEHNAVAPREAKPALMASFLLDQLRVVLERISDLMRVLPSLLQWIGYCHRNAVGRDGPVIAVGAPEGVYSSVLHFQHQ